MQHSIPYYHVFSKSLTTDTYVQELVYEFYVDLLGTSATTRRCGISLPHELDRVKSPKRRTLI
jgi:hypothetical protein